MVTSRKFSYFLSEINSGWSEIVPVNFSKFLVTLIEEEGSSKLSLQNFKSDFATKKSQTDTINEIVLKSKFSVRC